MISTLYNLNVISCILGKSTITQDGVYCDIKDSSHGDYSICKRTHKYNPHFYFTKNQTSHRLNGPAGYSQMGHSYHVNGKYYVSKEAVKELLKHEIKKLKRTK